MLLSAVLVQGEFLADLAVVLCTAAVTSIVFQRLRLPLVLGHVLAGMIIGPHIPLPLVADPETVRTLSELGVILLMFSVGLEFSARRLADLGSSATLIALFEIGAVAWLGYVCGRAFGWDAQASAFLGSGVAIASTMVVGKGLLGRASGDARQRELVLGIVVAEDLVSVLLLAILTAVAAGVGLSAREFALTSAQLLFFLAILIAAGVLLVPRLLRTIPRRGGTETLLLAGVGICFAMALLAKLFGYSVALGAFAAGSLAAASGRGAGLRPKVRPLTDVFSAVFFVSVGMTIDPRLIVVHGGLALVLAAAVPLLKVIATATAGMLVGRGLQDSAQAGMRLVPVGEFAFIVAAAAGSLGPRREDLYAVFGAVCVGTIFLTPFAERHAGAVASHLARRMPKALVTFETLLATWYDKLHLHRERGLGWPGLLRAIAWIGVDAVLILAFVIGTSSALPRLSRFLDELLPGPLAVARWLVVAAAGIGCAPFATGIVLQTHRLAGLAAWSVFPASATGSDPAAAPRRALRLAAHVVLLGAIGLPILAFLQPFLPNSTGAVVLLLGLIAAGTLVWRGVANLEGHVRAGTQVVAEVLARQAGRHEPHDLEQVNRLLPGLGNLTPVRLQIGSLAVGRHLGELDVHGRTRATVVCLSRGDDGVLEPDGDLLLSSGDVIVLAGTTDAIEAALRLLAESADRSG
jgi:CPA2 family monovalent cation:H+ antiporter-2